MLTMKRKFEERPILTSLDLKEDVDGAFTTLVIEESGVPRVN